MASISKEGVTKDSAFMETYSKTPLTEFWMVVEPSEAKNHEQVASMIVGALKQPLKQWFR